LFFTSRASSSTELSTFPYTTLFRSKDLQWDFEECSLLERPTLEVSFFGFSLVFSLLGALPVPPPDTTRRSIFEKKSCLGSQHARSEEHTSELQSLRHLVCRLLLEKT